MGAVPQPKATRRRPERLNVRLLVGTLAALVVGGAGVHLLHGYQAGRHARALRRQAAREEAAGRFDRAADLYHRYLVFAPEDNDGLARYTLALDRRAGSAPASGQVLSLGEQVLARDPGRRDVRRTLAVRALQQGLYPLARTHLEILLQSSPGSGELNGLLARCREAEGDYDLAADSYEEAIKHAPTRLDKYSRLAELLRRQLDRPHKADRVMAALVKANPKSAAAHVARASYCYRYTSLDQAAGELEQARRLAPADAEILAASARLDQLRGRLGPARRFWERGLRLHGRDPGMVLGLAGLELEAGRPRQAVACLERGLRRLPDNPDLLFTLADVLIQEGDLDRAREVMARLEKGNHAALTDYLKGRTLLRKRRWLEAARALAQAAQAPDNSAALAGRVYLYLGRCHEELGEPDRRLEAYRRAVALDPSSAFAAVQLATALLAAGKPDEALDVCRRLTARPDAPAAGWALLGRALLQANLRMPPQKRGWDELGRVLDRAARAPGQAAATALLRSEVLVAQGRPDRARAVLDNVCRDHPNDPSLWVARANLALRLGDAGGAEKLLQQARARAPGRVEPCLALAELWARRGGPSAARGLARLETGLEAFAPDDRPRLLRALAAAQARLGNGARAERLARELTDRDPNDLPGRTFLLELCLQTGRRDGAGRVLKEIHALEGKDGTWWRYGQAALAVGQASRGDRSRLPEARRLVREIEARRPRWSRAPLLRARLAELDGQPDEALAGYLAALDLGEGDFAVVSRVVRLLAERGRFGEADQVVRHYEPQAPPGRDFARLAATVALRAGDFGRAADLALRAVPAGSRDYRDYLWLAGVLEEAGHATRAEKALGRATEVGDAIPDAWVARVRFLARAGRADKAEAALQEMASHLTGDPLILAQAQALEGLGRTERAEGYFREVLAHQPDDPVVLHRAARFYLRADQPARAEPILRALLDPAVAAPDDLLAWGRRQLALVLASRGAAARGEARALLERNRTPAGPSAEDQRAAAFVRAADPKQRRQALNALEAFRQRQPFPPADLFRLATVYEAAGDWPRYQARVREALAGDAPNPAYLSHHIRALVRRGLTAEARVWLARLANLEPDAAGTKDVRRLLRDAEDGRKPR